MNNDYRCAYSKKEHTCRGPLFRVKYKQKETIFCSEVIKNLIKLGHGVSIIERVPRTDLLREDDPGRYFFNRN